MTLNEPNIINIEHCDDDEAESGETNTRNEKPEPRLAKLASIIKDRAKDASSKTDSRGRRYRGPRVRRSNKHKDESKEVSSVPKDVAMNNAVMMLNEMFPPPRAPQYKVTSQTGPPNNPTFSMVCCIQDQTFPGEGKSKKEAKLACSQKAIGKGNF